MYLTTIYCARALGAASYIAICASSISRARTHARSHTNVITCTARPLMANVDPSGRGDHINQGPSHPQTPSIPVLRKENRGGYDCEFVERTSDAAQGGECPVCLLEPCLTSCCGHKYCRVCIERVKKDTKPCPLCNEPDFSFLQERALERYLDVWCCYKKVGCEWKGKLGKYEQHLNKTSSPECQVIGCQFVEVECMYECGEWFQRQHITTHQTQQCKKRPYSCDYCRDYSSTFEEVIKIHYPQCNKYPVDCPNKCREYSFERQELATHLKDECPLALVNCPFYYAGCDVQIPRKDMSGHMKDLTKHLTLLASVTHTIMKENQDLRETVKKMNQDHQDKMKATEDKTENLTEKIEELKLALTRYAGIPKDYRVERTENEVYLPGFYTHHNGYKMCICVDPNGYGDGEGTHISIFTYLMKGLYDDYLKWPFRGIITIQIVNQAGDHDHIEKTFQYNDETQDDSTAGRVTREERSDGWGEHQFLAHSNLEYNAIKKTQYLKDNHFIVRVVKIELM